MANAKKKLGAWNCKCEKAERALDNAVKRFNKASDDDATQEQLNALSKVIDEAQFRLQKVYENLPESLDDVAGEVTGHKWQDKMVEAGEVTPRKRKQITSEQVAEVVNRYISNYHALFVVDHVHSLNRHEWEIQVTAGYDIPHEEITAHNEILGRIWAEPKTEKGEVTGWTMGYGLAKGELRLVNKFRLATVFRGTWRAVENEFGGLDDEPKGSTIPVGVGGGN